MSTEAAAAGLLALSAALLFSLAWRAYRRGPREDIGSVSRGWLKGYRRDREDRDL